MIAITPSMYMRRTAPFGLKLQRTGRMAIRRGSMNAAVDPDGTVAAAITYPLSCDPLGSGSIPWNAGGIAVFDQSGAQIRLIDAGCDYWATQVAFGEDHSVWTIGYLGMTTASMTADYLTLRHYSQNGEQIGAFLPRDSFPHPDDPRMEPLILPLIGMWELRVTSDRVEIRLDRPKLLVETDMSGREI